ncbi:Uncharacterized protein Rs2_05548 [Raphanus sativus]|nr:Uncharacterized protein Rs2_05548 [Raphanus sativus]
MEFWGAKVKAGKTLKVKPGDNCLIHISQASLSKRKKGVSALLYATVDDKKLLLGTLSQDSFPHINFDHLLFDREFELSHTLDKGSVHFTGYKSKVSTRSKPPPASDEGAFAEMVCSAKQMMYPSAPDDFLLTKEDLEESVVAEKSTKALTTVPFYPRVDPYLTDSDEEFLSLVSTVDEEGMTHLEAHIEFRSIQELKLARKLNGHLMGNSRVFFDRTLGSLRAFFISGFNRDLREDDLKRQIKNKFKACGALKKIILPKEQGNLLGFGYIVMDITSEEMVLSMDSTIMGDAQICVKTATPRGRLFRALMESEG